MYIGDATTWNIPGGCNFKRDPACDGEAYALTRVSSPCTEYQPWNSVERYNCECCVTGECHGQPQHPWRPEHMDEFLRMHALFGPRGDHQGRTVCTATPCTSH